MKKSLEHALVPRITEAVNQAKIEVWGEFMKRFSEFEKNVNDRLQEHASLLDYYIAGRNMDVGEQKGNFMHHSSVSHEKSYVSYKIEEKCNERESNFMQSSKSSNSKASFRIYSAGTQKTGESKRVFTLVQNKASAPRTFRKKDKSKSIDASQNQPIFAHQEVNQNKASIQESKVGANFMISHSRPSISQVSRVFIQKNTMKQLQQSRGSLEKPLEQSVDNPRLLFDSIQHTINKASTQDSHLSTGNEQVGYFVKCINANIKNTDSILNHMLHSQSMASVNHDTTIHESIIDYGTYGKPRFEDFIDVPSNYDIEDIDDYDDKLRKDEVNDIYVDNENQGDANLNTEQHDTLELSRNADSRSIQSSEHGNYVCENIVDAKDEFIDKHDDKSDSNVESIEISSDDQVQTNQKTNKDHKTIEQSFLVDYKTTKLENEIRKYEIIQIATSTIIDSQMQEENMSPNIHHSDMSVPEEGIITSVPIMSKDSLPSIRATGNLKMSNANHPLSLNPFDSP